MAQTQTVPEQEPERTPKQWSLPIILVLLLVIGPWIGALIFGADKAAIPAIVLMAAAPLVLGFLDGRLFRVSWTFTALAVIANFVAGQLYYNDGVLIYTIAVGLLAWLGSKAGAATSPKREENTSPHQGKTASSNAKVV